MLCRENGEDAGEDVDKRVDKGALTGVYEPHFPDEAVEA